MVIEKAIKILLRNFKVRGKFLFLGDFQNLRENNPQMSYSETSFSILRW